MTIHGKKLAPLVLVVFLAAAFVLSATAAGGSLSVSPANPVVGVGLSTTVNLSLSGLAGVRGGYVEASFDPSIVQVVDADGSAPGVQIIKGSCPTPDFLIANDADNTAGDIKYAAVSTSGSCGGGNLASIQFTCVASGASPVTITLSELSDDQGFLITHSTQNGQIICSNSAIQIYMPLVMHEN